ncbi:MAG TPA: hypothetical protein VNJ05_00410 [Sphingomicrobium sp.]|nr:hypothetical protein [Sphingomicrobium sp.]
MARRFEIALGMALAAFGTTQASAQSLDSAAAVDEAASVEFAISSATVAATAEDEATPADDWNVSFTPYLWVAGTSGDIAIPRTGGDGVEIDKSFSDVLGNLKFAFMGALDVEHKRVVLIGDLMYLSVGAKTEETSDPTILEGKVDAKTLLATSAVGYRVVDKGPMFVDLFVGARLMSLDVEMELEGPLTTRTREADKSHISPLFGGRVRFPLGEKWGLALYADAGGFKSTDVKWQLVGSVQRDLGKHWRLMAGYRHMQLHHESDEIDFDVALSGPFLGFTYRF